MQLKVKLRVPIKDNEILSTLGIKPKRKAGLFAEIEYQWDVARPLTASEKSRVKKHVLDAAKESGVKGGKIASLTLV